MDEVVVIYGFILLGVGWFRCTDRELILGLCRRMSVTQILCCHCTKVKPVNSNEDLVFPPIYVDDAAFYS